MISFGFGKYKVCLVCHSVGVDRLIVISGGEKEHIGSASLVCSSTKADSLVKNGHMDHYISQDMAELIYEKLDEAILVICGIHIDNATKDELSTLVVNAHNCVNQFIKDEK